MTTRTSSSHGGVPLDEEKSPEANSQDAHDVGVNAHARPSNSPRNLGDLPMATRRVFAKTGSVWSMVVQ